jgi:hypothetical protein
LTDALVEIVAWWIGAGAPHSTTLGALVWSPEAAELIRPELGVDC